MHLAACVRPLQLQGKTCGRGLTCFVTAGLIKYIWLPVSLYHDFQSATIMAAAVLDLLCCLANCSPKTRRCQQLHHLLPFDINLLQVLCLSGICAGSA